VLVLVLPIQGFGGSDASEGFWLNGYVLVVAEALLL
jgi:hypothetical protein